MYHRRKATQSNVSFCRVASNGSHTCSSANFSTNGTSRGCVGELEDSRRDILGGFMENSIIIIEQLIKIMFLDY